MVSSDPGPVDQVATVSSMSFEKVDSDTVLRAVVDPRTYVLRMNDVQMNNVVADIE